MSIFDALIQCTEGLHRLTLAFVTVAKSHMLPQMAICVLFTPAAKTDESAHLRRKS